ncbi:MAG: galactokinase [Terriglobia bacterium]
MREFEATANRLRESGEFFLRGRPVYIARAPGRIDVMGGNVDYTGGLVFQMTTREATWAAQLRENDRIIFLNPQMRAYGWQDRAEFRLEDLQHEQHVRDIANQCAELRWTAYVLGPLHFLQKHFPSRMHSGVSVYLESNVPLNKGVSSSAAVEVATMASVARAYGIELEGVELAQACQWAENVIAESACGIMDQAAIVLGEEGSCLPLLCQPCTPFEPVRIPARLALWAIDSGVRHAVTGVEYEVARAACFMGYKLICDWEDLPLRLEDKEGIPRWPRWVDPQWNGYPSNILPSVFRSRYEHRLPETWTGAEFLQGDRIHADPFTRVRPEVLYPIRACARYAVEENHRIQLFVELIRGSGSQPSKATCELLGELMFQSHYSYTECGLGAEATDLIVKFVREEGPQRGMYGAKITGGGSGGTVAVLGDAEAEIPFRRVVERYAEIQGQTPHVFAGTSMGTGQFGVGVI